MVGSSLSFICQPSSKNKEHKKLPQAPSRRCSASLLVSPRLERPRLSWFKIPGS